MFFLQGLFCELVDLIRKLFWVFRHGSCGTCSDLEGHVGSGFFIEDFLLDEIGQKTTFALSVGVRDFVPTGGTCSC